MVNVGLWCYLSATMTINNSKLAIFISLLFSLSGFTMDPDSAQPGDESINIPDSFLGNTDDVIRTSVLAEQSLGAWREFKSNVGKVAFFSAGTAVTAYFKPGIASVVGMGGAVMLKDQATGIAEYYGLLPPNENMKFAQKLNEQEIEFKLKRDKFSQYNAKVGEEVIRAAREKIGYGLKSMHESELESVRNRQAKLELLFALPTTYSLSSSLRSAISTIQEHLKTYADKVADAVVSAVIEIHELSAARERLRVEGSSDLRIKATYLFLGEAGVGKTETAEMMAKALNRPFCKFSLASMSIADFFGEAAREGQWTGKMGKLGGFLRCFKNPDSGEKALDPIIFIDEIHDVLNSNHPDSIKFYSLLKNITDGNETTAHDLGADLKIDFSGATFIFASNSELEKDVAGAFGTRVTKIDFSNLTQEQKFTIANTAFEEYCKTFQYCSKTGDDRMIRKIVERDASPGARVLKRVINKFVLHRKHCDIEFRCSEFSIDDVILQNGGILAK